MAERMLDGRYRLVRRIGAGGMGEVWRAHDEHLHREVAVKLVKQFGPVEDPVVAARFVREARAVARLSSPHIVTVYELGTGSVDGGPPVPYLVMELLDGRRLDRIVHGGAGLPALDDVARWGGQMCKALDTAHAAEVVHRDMKSANVLVTDGDPADPDDSVVKVLDFGIARVLDGTGAQSALTVTGSLVGTPAYMSPEQARGDAHVDWRTDLYSLGCVLHELVTGRLPFEAQAWHVLLLKHMNEPPVPPSRLRAGLPSGWDELILDLLAKDAQARPGSAGEVRDRLAALGNGEAAPATPAPRTAPRARAPEAAPTWTRPTPGTPGPAAAHPPTRLDSGAAGPRSAERIRTGASAPPSPPSRPSPATAPAPPRPRSAAATPTPAPKPASMPSPAADPGASAPTRPDWLEHAGSARPAPAGRRPAATPAQSVRSSSRTHEPFSVAAVVLAVTIFVAPFWLALVLTALAGAGARWANVRMSRRYRGRHL
ncbi:protein kinase [Streptomyces sp. NPDC001868]|uniref:serine/threonine-protein kinase n=1 Tax=Streptomyces sp. NPDC001868 TaxID=3154401 RepID=UPI003322906C